MPQWVPARPRTMSHGPAQCGDRCWAVSVRVPSWGEVSCGDLLPTSPVQEEGKDGAAKEWSLLCQPGTVHTQCVPREPTESQIC